MILELYLNMYCVSDRHTYSIIFDDHTTAAVCIVCLKLSFSCFSCSEWNSIFVAFFSERRNYRLEKFNHMFTDPLYIPTIPLAQNVYTVQRMLVQMYSH